jgi:plastocyanin
LLKAAHHRRGAAILAIVVGVLTLVVCAPERGDSGTGVAPARNAARATAPEAGPAQTGPVTADAAPNMVWMGDHYFSPDKLTVKVGATVTWRMLGSQEHDVWSLDGSFRSPTMGPGSTYRHTFTKVGTFKYICLPHNGDGMAGEIIVVL